MQQQALSSVLKDYPVAGLNFFSKTDEDSDSGGDSMKGSM